MGKTTKSPSAQNLFFDPAVIGAAREHVIASIPVTETPCRICGAAGATKRSDGLCWVCLRLRVSAWRENDTPDSAGD